MICTDYLINICKTRIKEFIAFDYFLLNLYRHCAVSFHIYSYNNIYIPIQILIPKKDDSCFMEKIATIENIVIKKSWAFFI